MNFLLSGAALQVLIVLLITLIKPSDQAVYSCNASVSCGCSKNSAVVSRIVGGETAGSATWGWAVSLAIGDGYLCGGSIIASSWVLTAAHCVKDVLASQVTAYAGSTRRWAGSQNRVASQIIVHPSYNEDTYENDLALVKLATPFIMTDPNVSLICLPSVSAATLAAGEWPAAGTTVSVFFVFSFTVHFRCL
jgi:secreted trypsin-like serine protease